MAKDNEDVSKETVREALAIQTKALLGFTDVIKQLIESVGHLRKAVSLMSEQMDSLEKKNG